MIFALEHASRAQDLGSVADGGNGLVRVREIAHDFQNARVQPKILRRTASRNEQRIEVIRLNLVKTQLEVVAALLTVGLANRQPAYSGRQHEQNAPPSGALGKGPSLRNLQRNPQ
jgi:hypothetical protein